MKKLLGFVVVCLFFVGCASEPSNVSSKKSFSVSSTGHSKYWIADKKTGCKVWNQQPGPNEAVTWSGKCVNGFAQGNGTLQWHKNGIKTDKYVGNYVEGKMHGKGKHTWVSSGNVYEGDWVDNKRHGYGKALLAASGSIYEGDWVDGDMHGYGIKWKADGQIQNGIWKNHKFISSHTGPTSNETVTWSGKCVNGLAQGKGTLQWYKNSIKTDKYVGNYVDGKMHGKGKYTGASGDIYYGDFVDDKKHGKGEYTWGSYNKNCDSSYCDKKFVGELSYGEFKYGKLTFYNTNDYYEGGFDKNGKRKGKTRYQIAEDNRRYERTKNCQHLYVGKTFKAETLFARERFSVVSRVFK
jgi:uncharacterized protein YceK